MRTVREAAPEPPEHRPAPQASTSRRGEPLPPTTAATLGARYGHDFSAVRVHTEARSATQAQGLHAHAFTVGQDVHFAPGRYEPYSADGQRLIAHELAHVVQQGGRPPSGTAPDRSAERAADDAAARAIAGAHVKVPTITAAGPQLAADTAVVPGTLEADHLRQGVALKDFGRVDKTEGVRLRDRPSTTNGVELARLPFNTRVFVDSEINGWYFVTLDDGRSGFCAESHISTGLPEPDAIIHRIVPGDTALGISRQYYGGRAEWGSDHRFFVNGLVHVNAGTDEREIDERGIEKPADGDWEDTKVKAGYMIWIPSLVFMRGLRGKVSSGSITHEAWQSVKSASEAVANFVVGGAAFIAGLIHGALESLWDVVVGLKDLAEMIWSVLKSLVTGSLLSVAGGLWDQLKKLDWVELVKGWLGDFENKWNADSILSRWHFRGWVIGYAIMEILMLVLSDGLLNGIKWIAKASKVTKAISSAPKVAELVRVVRSSEKLKGITRPSKLGAQKPRASTLVKTNKAAPEDVLDDFITKLDDVEQPFALDIGKKRQAQLVRGEKNLTDTAISFDIDEPLAVGAKNLKRSRAYDRAIDPHNRQLLDPNTNRYTKHLHESPAYVLHRKEVKPKVSVKDDPSAIFTRRFDEVTELDDVFRSAVNRYSGRRDLTPTKLKDAINREVRDVIRDGRTPAGRAVRDALEASGFAYVEGRGFVAVRVATP